MIFHAKAATCMPGHALELFVPALMLLRACATMHAAHTHAAGDQLAEDGQQAHTYRAQSALDGHSGFDHAFIMSVQTKSRGQRGMRAPLHRRTALPPGSEHASHSQNLDFPKSKTVRSRTHVRSLTFLGKTPPFLFSLILHS